MLDRLFEWDSDILVFLNNLGTQPWDGFWETITKYPPWIPLFILFVYLIVKTYRWKQALVIFLVLLIMLFFVTTVTDLTKSVVGRVRPNNDGEIRELIRVLRNPKGYSFFSAHASISFSIVTYIVLFLEHRFKWVYLFYIWPLLFVMSRIIMGVHFPSDLLVGASVGLLSGWIFYKLYRLLILPYLR